MNELNYPLMYQYQRNLSNEYEKYKCDPRKYNITYCNVFIEDDCPKTCEYAADLERKLNEDSQ
jgi:hypothetical protein